MAVIDQAPCGQEVEEAEEGPASTAPAMHRCPATRVRLWAASVSAYVGCMDKVLNLSSRLSVRVSHHVSTPSSRLLSSVTAGVPYHDTVAPVPNMTASHGVRSAAVGDALTDRRQANANSATELVIRGSTVAGPDAAPPADDAMPAFCKWHDVRLTRSCAVSSAAASAAANSATTSVARASAATPATAAAVTAENSSVALGPPTTACVTA